jgi:hypothetical protein
MYAQVRPSGEGLNNYVALLWFKLASPVVYHALCRYIWRAKDQRFDSKMPVKCVFVVSGMRWSPFHCSEGFHSCPIRWRQGNIGGRWLQAIDSMLVHKCNLDTDSDGLLGYRVPTMHCYPMPEGWRFKIAPYKIAILPYSVNILQDTTQAFEMFIGTVCASSFAWKE